jgi:hypothetical protein
LAELCPLPETGAREHPQSPQDTATITRQNGFKWDKLAPFLTEERSEYHI